MREATCVSCGRSSEAPVGWALSSRGNMCPSCAAGGNEGLRDRFACAAMQALLDGQLTAYCGANAAVVSKAAYIMADAMLAERDKSQQAWRCIDCGAPLVDGRTCPRCGEHKG